MVARRNDPVECTHSGVTIMFAALPTHIRDYAILQVTARIWVGHKTLPSAIAGML